MHSEWLEVARGKPCTSSKHLVTGKAPGDTPCSPSDGSAQRHVLRFEVTSETLALFREAMNQLRRSSGTHLNDDSALLLIARHVLGGPRDDGRASYQVALSVCPDCGRSGQQAGGDLVPVGMEIMAMADCDAQHLGLIDAPIANANASATANANASATANANASATANAHTGAGA